MSILLDNFKNCYLVQYSLRPDNTIEAIRSNSLVEVNNNPIWGEGTFIGLKGSSKFGIRFNNRATHLGLFDLSDLNKPVMVYSVAYEDLEPNKTQVIKVRGAYAILKRGNKNFKFLVSLHKTRAEARKSSASTPKLDPQTAKINSSLKNLKHKKAT